MSNTATLDKFVSIRQDIQNQIDDLRLVPMNLRNIHKNGNTFYHNDTTLESSSLKSLLGVLGVKESLVSEIKDDRTQWEPLHEALSNIKQDKTVTAVFSRHNNNITQVINRGIKDEKPIDLTNGLRYTEEFLKNTNANLELQDFNFDPENICININFKNPDADIDVFGDGKDLWKAGFGLQFHLNKFASSPYFNRLVCSNGMVAAHRMSQRFVNSDELNQRTFDRQVQKYVGPVSNMDEVKTYCRRLSENNASLREYFGAHDRISSFSKELAEEVFPQSEILGRYRLIGIDARKQNSRWLATANSNVNSYDVFNRLTNVASHRLTDREIATRMEINRLASDLFFTGPDFKTMAPDPFKMNLATPTLDA
jgi:hypothetical protein